MPSPNSCGSRLVSLLHVQYMYYVYINGIVSQDQMTICQVRILTMAHMHSIKRTVFGSEWWLQPFWVLRGRWSRKLATNDGRGGESNQEIRNCSCYRGTMQKSAIRPQDFPLPPSPSHEICATLVIIGPLRALNPTWWRTAPWSRPVLRLGCSRELWLMSAICAIRRLYRSI